MDVAVYIEKRCGQFTKWDNLDTYVAILELLINTVVAVDGTVYIEKKYGHFIKRKNLDI